MLCISKQTEPNVTADKVTLEEENIFPYLVQPPQVLVIFEKIRVRLAHIYQWSSIDDRQKLFDRSTDRARSRIHVVD